jgi:hypothetical protein
VQQHVHEEVDELVVAHDAVAVRVERANHRRRRILRHRRALMRVERGG